jgi:hypothetical protein
MNNVTDRKHQTSPSEFQLVSVQETYTSYVKQFTFPKASLLLTTSIESMLKQRGVWKRIEFRTKTLHFIGEKGTLV